MKKTIYLLIAILLILGGIFAYQQYNKPHRDASTESPFTTITAEELFDAFDQDEINSTAKYVDKVLEINGTVIEILEGREGEYSLVLKTNHPVFGIKCAILSENPSPPEVGAEVTIRGICSGFNSDVEISRCILIQ